MRTKKSQRKSCLSSRRARMYLNGSPEMPPRLLRQSRMSSDSRRIQRIPLRLLRQSRMSSDSRRILPRLLRQSRLNSQSRPNSHSRSRPRILLRMLHLLRSRTRKSAGERQRQRRKKSSARALHHRSVRRQICCWQRANVYRTG